MTITNVTIHKTFTEGKMKAIVSAVIDDCLKLRDIKIIQGTDRLFVAMPNRKNDDGSFVDVIHPLYREAREFIEMPILNAYDNYLAQMYLTE